MNAVELSFALRSFRDAAGYTDAQAAAALGLSYTTFCQFKCQRSFPKPLLLDEIERRLRGRRSILNPDPAAAEFAATLVAWRGKGGLSQRAAAMAFGVSVSTVRDLELCVQAPTPGTLLRLMPVLTAPPPAAPPKPSRHDTTFGPRLRAWRKASRLDQRQACALLGISDKATLSHYERSRAMPCAARLASIEQIIARGPALTASTHAEIAFPQRLRAWRKTRGLIQPQACASLGIPDMRTLSDYERGDAYPRPDRLAQIEAVITSDNALPAALAEIELMQVKLDQRQARCIQLESKLQREQRAIERLRHRIECRQREATSLRVLS